MNLTAIPNKFPAKPIALLKEGTRTSTGKDSQYDNLASARLLAELMKASLGPLGMDKMFVTKNVVYKNDVVTVTKDGLAILKELDITHPVGLVLRDVAAITDKKVGDGATSVVLLTGSLIQQGDKLAKEKVHPVIVVDGFQRAARKTVEVLERYAETIDVSHREALKQVARTSMQTNDLRLHAEHLTDVVVDAVLSVVQRRDGRCIVDTNDIIMERRRGAMVSETRLIYGRLLKQPYTDTNMPRRIEGAKIALLFNPITLPQSKFVGKIDMKVTMTSPETLHRMKEEQDKLIKEMVDKIRRVGANVLITHGENLDRAQGYLARAGIMSIHKIMENQVPTIERVSGAKAVKYISDLKEEDLGYADLVEISQIEAEDPIKDKPPNLIVFIEGCRNPKAVSVFVRGTTKRIVNDAERSMRDALMVVKDVVEEPLVVIGGGAAEMEAAVQVRNWAKTLEGREQLAAERFADALEEIPSSLAENAGLNPLDAIPELRARHLRGERWYGVDWKSRKLKDLREEQVFEPLAVKRQVVEAATMSACQVLRVDRVVIKKYKNDAGYTGGAQG